MVVCACHPSTAGVGAGLQVQGQPRPQREKKLGREKEEGERGKEEKEREREEERRNKEEDTKEKDLEQNPCFPCCLPPTPCNIFHVTTPFLLCIEKGPVPFQVSQAKGQSPVSVWSGIPVHRSRACSTWASSL